jgi:hypothetical protein
MKLYQWYNQGIDRPSLTFVRDAEDGGCIVQCPIPCCEEFNCDLVDNCPKCGSDLVFPRCDW